jgi:hypothetical protein
MYPQTEQCRSPRGAVTLPKPVYTPTSWDGALTKQVITPIMTGLLPHSEAARRHRTLA